MGANERHVLLARSRFCCPQRLEEKYYFLYSRLSTKAPPVKLIRIITWNMKAPFVLGRKAFHSETLLDPYDEFIECRNKVIRRRKPWFRGFCCQDFLLIRCFPQLWGGWNLSAQTLDPAWTFVLVWFVEARTGTRPILKRAITCVSAAATAWTPVAACPSCLTAQLPVFSLRRRVWVQKLRRSSTTAVWGLKVKTAPV